MQQVNIWSYDKFLSFKSKFGDRKVRDNRRLCIFLCILILNVFASNVTYFLIPDKHDKIALLLKIICGFYFLICIPVVLRNLTILKCLLVYGSTFVMVINLLLFKNSQLTSTAVFFFTTSLTSFLVTDAIQDFNMLRRYLVNSSRFVGLVCILILIINFSGTIYTESVADYYMGLGYSCIVTAIVLIWNFFEYRKIKDLIYLVGNLSIILLYGSRGPFIGIILFTIYFGSRYLIKKGRYLLCTLMIVFLASIKLCFINIMNSLYYFMTKMGIQSRTLYLFISNDVNRDSGRDVLWEKIINEIIENPFKVRGINADYTLIKTYAHNLVLEIVYQHGILIGGVALCFIFYKVIETIFLDINKDFSIICIVFMFASIPSLMVSASVWTSQNFWIWIALILNKKRFKSD